MKNANNSIKSGVLSDKTRDRVRCGCQKKIWAIKAIINVVFLLFAVILWTAKLLLVSKSPSYCSLSCCCSILSGVFWYPQLLYGLHWKFLKTPLITRFSSFSLSFVLFTEWIRSKTSSNCKQVFSMLLIISWRYLYVRQQASSE